MDTRTWVSDNLIKLAGASDPTIVDFVIATASSAKSSQDLASRLSAVLDNSPGDIDAFSSSLFHRSGKTNGDGGANTAPASRKPDRKKYSLVDMGAEEIMPVIQPRQPKEKSKTSSSSRREKSSRHSRSPSPRERTRDRRSEPRPKKYRKRDDDFDDKWADQDDVSGEDEGDGSGDDEMFAEPEPKRRKVSASPSRRSESRDRELSEDEDARDQREKEEYEARLREREAASKDKGRSNGRGGRDSGLSRDMNSARLESRQQYLEKREAERLYLLRKQVEEEAQEERENPDLTPAELAQFRRNREVLALAEKRRNIDEHTDGYAIPTENLEDRKQKHKVLNERIVDRDQYGREVYVSEEQQWEAEQAAKARAQISRADRDEGNYEYVFDESQRLQYILDAASAAPKMTSEQKALQEKLTAAQAKAQSIDEVRKSLPVYEYRQTFLDAVAKYQFLVIVGETGSGKTTQLPQYLREAGYCKDKDANGQPMKIGITQPRRVAAMSVAQRVSEETGTRLGKEVGYSIRFEDQTSPDTELKYMTDGMLMRELMTDPLLSSYSAIMIDEAHERSVSTDVLMALIKDIARTRADLKVAIMSATVNSQKFSSYFEDCPILMIPGRRFNVDIYYSPQPEANYLAAAITTVFQIHISTPVRRQESDLPGDILVFLTGQDEIDQAMQSIEETMRKLGAGPNGKVAELIVVPIYANLPPDMQRKIFEPTPFGTRKVVLATNIAETSLTIDSVVYVIDSGFSKVNIFNPRTSLESLIAEPISRASANQRAGRAGRVCPGKCFRLWTKHAFFNDMPEETTPEIQRTSIASLVLLLKSLGVEDLLNFDFIDPPPPDTIIKALEMLYSLGALNDRGSLTKIGRQMAEMPIDPMKSKAILQAGKAGCTSEVLSIVAMLDETAALFIRPKAGDSKRVQADSTHARFRIPDNKSDHLTLLNIFEQWADAEYSAIWAKEMFLNQRSLTRARDVRDQLTKLLERVELELSSVGLQSADVILKALTAGFFPNAARLQRDGQSYRTVGATGLSVHLHPSSGLLEERPKWVVYDSLVLTSKEFMRNCFTIRPDWLVDAAPHYHKQTDLDKLGVDKKMPKARAAQSAVVASKF